MQDRPDIIATIQLFPTASGGRKGPTPETLFRCSVSFQGELFDCVLYLQDVGALVPGETAKIPVRFLRPDLIKSRLKPGTHFYIWELGEVAEGVVEEVVSFDDGCH